MSETNDAYGKDAYGKDGAARGGAKAGAAFFDGVAKLIAETAGAADGVRREAETVLHSQLQRFLSDMDLVPREEFEAVRDMAAQALDEVDALKAEVAALKGEG